MNLARNFCPTCKEETIFRGIRCTRTGCSFVIPIKPVDFGQFNQPSPGRTPRLSDAGLREMRIKCAAGIPRKILAGMYGMSLSQTKVICRGIKTAATQAVA